MRREFRVFETNKNKKKLSFFLVLPLEKGKEVSLSLSLFRKSSSQKSFNKRTRRISGTPTQKREEGRKEGRKTNQKRRLFITTYPAIIIMTQRRKKQTHYDVLEVTPEATQAEIRKAYHKLAIRCHPDKSTELECKEEKTEQFKKISAAYTCLSDPKEREKYDERLSGRFGVMTSGGFYDESDEDIDDVFGDQFSSSQDLERRLFCARVGIAECVVRVIQVSLEDIFEGNKVHTESVPVFKADFVDRRVVPSIARVRVVVPRNARDGDTIYCRSDGSQMQRVAVVIREKPHELFSRSENKRDDIIATVRLTRKECEEGTVKIIKGLNGREIKLKVNKGAVEKGKDKWHTVIGEGFYVSKPRMDVNGTDNTNNNGRNRGDLRVRFRQMSGFEAFWRKGSRLWWAKRIGGSIVAYVALELGATALLHVLLDAWDILEGPGDQLFLDSFPGLYGIIPSTSIIFAGRGSAGNEGSQTLHRNINHAWNVPRDMPDNIRSEPPPRRPFSFFRQK